MQKPIENLHALLSAFEASMHVQVDDTLPSDEPTMKMRFLECVQALDFLLISSLLKVGDEMREAETIVFAKSWNMILRKLLQEFSHRGIYLNPKVEEAEQVLRLLYMYGLANTTSLAVSLAQSGQVSGEFSKSGVLKVWRNNGVQDPFLSDGYEFRKLKYLQDKIDSADDESFCGWGLVGKEDPSQLEKLGAYRLRSSEFPGKALYREDLQSIIYKLVRPFRAGSYTITAYDADVKTDYHFLMLATELSAEWRDEAGLHPDITVKGFLLGDMLKVVVILASLHIKHIKFCTVAAEKHPEIMIQKSFSIWTTRDELIESICALSDGNLQDKLVATTLDILIFNKRDAENLFPTSPMFIPLLIDMGGDMVLRPASSVMLNPFETFKVMLKWRIPNFQNLMAPPREDWIRADIYSMFGGTRYVTIPGNVKLRSKDKILTDIDAAVFDRTTGELALFQIKWQDYLNCSEKERRSRAKNLAKEIDDWASAVYRWIAATTVLDVATTFRIPLDVSFPKAIYLFAISQRVARTKSYGAVAQHGGVALCNFAQFSIARTEIGPVANVINDLHERLFAEMDASPEFVPVPVQLTAPNGTIIQMQDLFYRLSESEGSGAK